MNRDLLKSQLFSDQVFSVTDLNRRHRQVLDEARKGPITISRNNEQFALMRREQVANLVRSVSELDSATEVLWGAVTAEQGQPVPRNLSWLLSFDADDLRRLSKEVVDSIRDAIEGNSEWDDVNALIHQWRESAIAAQSGALAASMQEPPEETSLSHPSSLAPEGSS